MTLISEEKPAQLVTDIKTHPILISLAEKKSESRIEDINTLIYENVIKKREADKELNNRKWAFNVFKNNI